MEQTRQQIQLNYQKTLQQASELERLANQIDTIVSSEIDEVMKNISDAWKGDSGSTYCTKGNRLNVVIKQHSRDLRNAANILKRTAENTYRAELLSIEIAEKRRYQ